MHILQGENTESESGYASPSYAEFWAEQGRVLITLKKQVILKKLSIILWSLKV